MMKSLLLSLPLVFVGGLFLWVAQPAHPLHAEPGGGASTPTRRVNVPYTRAIDPIPVPDRAIFWFGQVTPTANYVDARIIYNDEALYVTLHIFDKWLLFDNSPEADELTAWDSAALYLDLNGRGTDAATSQSFRFIAQFNPGPRRAAYQAASRGNGTAWRASAIPFETTTSWRDDDADNGTAARGWIVTFKIPFQSLALTPPPTGSTWKMAVVAHDRDNENSALRDAQLWPETADPDRPITWGELHFGLPSYSPPSLARMRSLNTTVIRHGLDGARVTDGHVGGGATCAEALKPAYFEKVGDANYAGATQVNVQNQWDIADWPCFSKFYLTLPLDSLPQNATVISATLTLHQFGNARPSEALPSYIQLLTVGEGWDEQTLTWNSAPLPLENIGGTRVEPLPAGDPAWPGVPREWEVSRAVADALASSLPLRLVLYSADGAYHSGKYFSSSDTADWNETARPTLKILWGDTGQNDTLPLLCPPPQTMKRLAQAERLASIWPSRGLEPIFMLLHNLLQCNHTSQKEPW